MNITANIFLLETPRFSNVFLIKDEDHILIDTGMPGQTKRILGELTALNIEPKTISHILLTHHDVDHTGNIKKLQEATGATVWIGSDDAPYLMGEMKRPGVKRIIQSVIRPQKPADCRYFEGSGNFGKLQAIPTPGHTPGHHIFQYNSVVFTGDLFKTPNGRFKRMPPRMNWEEGQLLSSLSLLRTLSFDWLCPSHGVPVRNSGTLEKFLDKECRSVGKCE